MTASIMHEFPDGAALANALADTVADALLKRLTQDERAVLAVSGGRTPVRFFEALSQCQLDWASIAVTLVDERWVPDDSDRSNARLVRMHLLRGQAAAARFVPLTSAAMTPEEGREMVEQAIAALPLPLAVAVLGMGTDGHTASFFPGGDRLGQALAPVPGRKVETIRAIGADEPRITLTLPMLLAADRLILHIEGEEKKRVLEAAMRGGPVEEIPVRAVLRGRGRPLEVFWAPD